MPSKIQLKLCRNLEKLRIPLRTLSVNGHDVAIGVVMMEKLLLALHLSVTLKERKRYQQEHRTKLNEKSILTLLCSIVPGLFQFLGIAELEERGILKLLLKRKLVGIVKAFMVSGSFISL